MMKPFQCAAALYALVMVAFGAQKPNILFLMTDSMDGKLFATFSLTLLAIVSTNKTQKKGRNMDPTSAQYPLMNMPNLRGIASQGVTFTRHYTNSPQCVPGRSALFSGRRTDNTRAFNNALGFMMSSGYSVDPKTGKVSHSLKGSF